MHTMHASFVKENFDECHFSSLHSHIQCAHAYIHTYTRHAHAYTRHAHAYIHTYTYIYTHIQSLSSQSLPAHLSNKDRERQASPTPSLSNYPLYSQLRPTLGSYGGIPLANSTLTGQSHLSGSNSSLSSIKSTNSAVSQDRGSHTYLRNKLVPDHSARYLRSHFPFSSTPRYVAPQLSSSHSDVSATGHSNGYTSRTLLSANRDYLSSSKPTGQGEEAISPVFSKAHSGSSIDRTLTSPEVELHRSKLKIKQLQKEVWCCSIVSLQLLVIAISHFNCCNFLVCAKQLHCQGNLELTTVESLMDTLRSTSLGPKCSLSYT